MATTFLDIIDDLITKRADRRARDLDLVITRIPGTRTQSYRDPRWDLRGACEDCLGSGARGAHACVECAGTGVVTRQAGSRAEEPR